MCSEKILVVDDEQPVRDAISRLLQAKGFETQTAHGPDSALAIAAQFQPDLILTDIRMPGMDGVEFARRVKRDHPGTPVIMMTAYADVDSAIAALQLGVDDYIRKPMDWLQAVASIRATLDRRAVTMGNKRYIEELERRLLQAQRTQGADLLGAVKGLFSAEGGAARSAILDTVESLAAAIGARDPRTKDHSRKVGAYVARMAERLSFSSAGARNVRLAGLLHDIGKLGVPDEILCKSTGEMTEEEFDRYKEHPVLSHRILQPIREFQPILDTVLHHHERFDAKGFPDGLSGAAIPIGARMIAVADAFCCRVVEEAPGGSEQAAFAVECLIAERGTRFDPDMVDAFIETRHLVQV